MSPKHFLPAGRVFQAIDRHRHKVTDPVLMEDKTGKEARICSGLGCLGQRKRKLEFQCSDLGTCHLLIWIWLQRGHPGQFSRWLWLAQFSPPSHASFSRRTGKTCWVQQPEIPKTREIDFHTN
jgi:hypothetical protein